jgi:outer membrane protein assembly factor BamB
MTPWLPTDAGDLRRLRYEIPSLPYSQEADCFFQDCWLDACHRAAVADAGHGQHFHVCTTSDNVLNASATTSTAPSPADWTQFHRDNMQRWNPYETVLGVGNVGGLQLKWESGFPGSSPAVVNGVVYVGSDSSGIVSALDANTGAQLWFFNTGFGVAAWPAVANGVVNFGSHDLTVYGVNASTGAGLWSYDMNSDVGPVATSQPTVADGVVYIGSQANSFDGAFNALYALNASTGVRLWASGTGMYEGVGAVAGSPAVANGVVYFGSDDIVNAVKSTGAQLWTFATGNTVESSPAVANGVVYVGSDDANLYALNASTGAKLWSYTTGNQVHSSPAVANGVVYVGSGDGNLYALNASTGVKLWSYTTGAGVNSSPAVANGVVYVGSDDGNIYALNASTGAKLWSYATGDPSGLSSPAIVDGVVYIGGGNFYAFSLGGSSADLFLRIIPTTTTVQQGDLITYAFPVWNLGLGNADHEVLNTQVPAGTTFDNISISGTPGLGTCTTPPSGGTGQIVCHENGVMFPNTTWTVQLTVKVTAPTGTVITESATTKSDTLDPNLANNTATVSTTVLGNADLFLRVLPSTTTVHQGDLLTYTFPVWDLGPSGAYLEVLNTQVPAGTTFDYIRISGTPGLGTCTTPRYQGTGSIVCNQNGVMAPNTTWTVRLTVAVTASAGTVITENAATMADTPDPNLANNTATVSLTVVP